MFKDNSHTELWCDQPKRLQWSRWRQHQSVLVEMSLHLLHPRHPTLTNDYGGSNVKNNKTRWGRRERKQEKIAMRWFLELWLSTNQELHLQTVTLKDLQAAFWIATNHDWPSLPKTKQWKRQGKSQTCRTTAKLTHLRATEGQKLPCSSMFLFQCLARKVDPEILYLEPPLTVFAERKKTPTQVNSHTQIQRSFAILTYRFSARSLAEALTSSANQPLEWPHCTREMTKQALEQCIFYLMICQMMPHDKILHHASVISRVLLESLESWRQTVPACHCSKCLVKTIWGNN